MALDANLEWDVEKYGVYFIVVVLGELDPVLTLLRCQVRSVHIIHGPLGDKARFEHRAQVRKHKILETLFAHVVKEKGADHIAGEWDHVVPLEPGTFAGS